jgi:hypothetical protein
VKPAALVFGVCAVAVGMVTRRFRGDIGFQDWLATPVGVGASGALALATLVSFVLWNVASDKRALLFAVLSVTVANAALLGLAVRVGWLAGTAFRPPLWQQALAYGPGLLCFLAVPLAIHRWIAMRSRWGAALVYFAIVAAVSAASVPVERGFLARGEYVFGGSYNMAWDIAWGAAQFLIGLALYLMLEARITSRRSAA